MKQPEPTTQKGKKIYLKNVLKYFDDFKIKEPIVWVVGGIVNHGFTRGDIDILINLPPEESDNTISKVIRFRVQRSFPQKLWARLHWLYNDGAGPFTSNVPLFSLEARKMKLEKKEMSAATEIKPLKFFKQLKGMKGRKKKEIFSIKTLKEIIPEGAYPIEVNMKYDGMRTQIHKKDSTVKIWTEDGGNVTHRFPTFVSQIKQYPHTIVLDVEITGAIKGKHIGRSDVAGYAHRKDKPDDSPFVANVHDKVYFKDVDMHKWERWKRMKLLKETRIGNKYKIIPFKIARSPNELERYVNYFSNMKDSEGAMLKENNSIYELDGLTTKWWKFKKDFVIDAKVVKVNKVTGTDSYNYLCVIDKNVPIGKTYNTDLKVNIGDIIQVAFGNLNKYLTNEKVWYNWVFPRVIGEQEGKTKPDDTTQADILNKESGGFIDEKPFPFRYKEFLTEEELIKDIKDFDPKSLNNRQLLDDHRITHAWASTILSGGKLKYSIKEVKELHDKIVKEMEKRGFVHKTPIELAKEHIRQIIDYKRAMKKPIDLKLWDAFDEFIELSKKKRFVYQHHWRGKSLHGDLRFELPEKKALEGYTIAVQKASLTTEPIDTYQKSLEEDKRDIYKIDYKTGKPREQKILIFTKSIQPIVWLEQKGTTKRTEPGAPPQPGATRFYPGVFNIIDKGLYEPGARKPFFREYFMEGKVFKGRYIVRKLPRTRKWKEAGKVPFVWFFWRPEEQSPYILSTRALKKQDFPVGEDAESWLPTEWEKRIPKELIWWGKDLTREEATERIREARKDLKKKELLREKSTEFILHRHWWKGQKVIRDLPVEHWDLRFTAGFEFTLDKNPLFDAHEINAVYRKEHDISKPFEEKDQIIPPGEKGNPNKKIPANIETLDKGKVNIIARTEDFISAEFKGKHLKGFWTFRRLDKGEQWVMNRGKLPETHTLSEFEVESIIDLSDPQLRNSRIDIARQAGCSASAVYLWQKKADLL